MRRCGKRCAHSATFAFRIGCEYDNLASYVTLIPSISRNVSGGIYQVTKQLPHNGLDFEYHIKSANEQHQRVARERELVKA